MAELKIIELERLSDPHHFAILALDGEIDPHSVGKLKKTLKSLMEQNIRSIVLDMQKTSYVNSSALAVLVKFAHSFKEKGGGIAITHVNARVRLPFEMLGLLVFFQFFDSNEAARASLTKEL